MVNGPAQAELGRGTPSVISVVNERLHIFAYGELGV